MTPDRLWSIVNHFVVVMLMAGEAGHKVCLVIQWGDAPSITCFADPQKVMDGFVSQWHTP